LEGLIRILELNKIYNTNAIEFMKSMILNGTQVDLLVTDPPYKVISGGGRDGAHSKRPKGVLARHDGKLFDNTDIKISDWMQLVYDCLKDNSHAYIFTNALNLNEMLNEALKVGFKLHNILVWEKNNCTPSQFYMKNCEYILFLRKGKAKWINDIGGSKTVHQFNNIIGHKLHPTEKPVDLLKFYIANSSKENDVVFDPFAGSGSTGVAALELHRRFLGCELDTTYCKIAEKRISDAMK
jgi:site-specific DNA-methyltransferase (adenine-specific)